MSTPSKMSPFWLTFGTFFATVFRVSMKSAKKTLKVGPFQKSNRQGSKLGSKWGGNEGGTNHPLAHFFVSAALGGPGCFVGPPPPQEPQWSKNTILGQEFHVVVYIFRDFGSNCSWFSMFLFYKIKLNIIKKNGERSALYFSLFGSCFCRQSTKWNPTS